MTLSYGIIMLSAIAFVIQQGKIVDFGPQPTPRQLDEINTLSADLYRMLLGHFANNAAIIKREHINGVIEFSTAKQIYMETKSIHPFSRKEEKPTEIEGPAPGGFILRSWVRLRGQLESPSRGSILTRSYGTCYLGHVGIPDSPYEIAYDYLSAEASSKSAVSNLANSFKTFKTAKAPSAGLTSPSTPPASRARTQ